MENRFDEYILEGISGINFSVNENYINSPIHYFLKDSQCSCTKIGNFHMLYVNQSALSPILPLVDSVAALLAKLFHFGLLSFYEGFRYDYQSLIIWIKNNLSSILNISEISIFWDYPITPTTSVPKMSRLETTLLRHNSVWTVYDKRNYISENRHNLRNYSILTNNPIRMEFHISLKNCDFLTLSILNQNIPTLFDSLSAYIQKSHSRWEHTGLLPLPTKYNLTGRIPHSALPKASF